MRLILVRHGESRHSQEGVIADVRGCTGLTDRGRGQIRALAERLARDATLRRADALLTSPVPRARECAEVLAGALPGVVLAEDSDLRELLPGEADGMTWNEYRRRYGEFDLMAEPERALAPGGESWAAFTARVHTTLERLARDHRGRTVVAATHAGFIVASVLVTLAIPRPGTRARLEPRHASLTEWRVDEGTWVLERFNDAAHLDWS